jgi:di/tricarboxylate transporter
MPTADTLVVLGIVLGAMAFFISGKLRVDLTALCVLVALVLTGQIRSSQVLTGFASPATATVAAMFVLSAGLLRTGLVQWLARKIDRVAGATATQLVLVLCVFVAALSTFVVNTATVAMLIPVAIVLAEARKVSPSRVLMPLSFASQFGGVCTLLGTSTNILVNSIAVERGMEPFRLFEFAPLGAIMAGIGILYLLIVTPRLLPSRRGRAQRIDRYRLADYLVEFRVRKGSSMIGKTWAGSDLGKREDVELIKVLRDRKATWHPKRIRIREGDVMLLHGNADRLISMADGHGLESLADAKLDDSKLGSDKVKLVEAIVPPRSSLVGRAIGSTELLRRRGGVALALQRRGRVIRDRLANVRLDAGDALLLQGDESDVARMMRSSDLVVTSELTDLYVRKDRAATALVVFLAVIMLAAFQIVPIVVAALIGAVGMILGRCLSIEEAYRAVDWQVVFLLGGILPLGLAIQQSGAAVWLAGMFLSPLTRFGPVVVLAGLYIVTALLTETMSNNAAAVLLAPVALSLAASLGVDPRPLLVAITFAASTSFATPVGYQTNTMIYAPGGYRFGDFTRIGGPLNFVFWVVAVLLIPRFWPFCWVPVS